MCIYTSIAKHIDKFNVNDRSREITRTKESHSTLYVIDPYKVICMKQIVMDREHYKKLLSICIECTNVEKHLD